MFCLGVLLYVIIGVGVGYYTAQVEWKKNKDEGSAFACFLIAGLFWIIVVPAYLIYRGIGKVLGGLD